MRNLINIALPSLPRSLLKPALVLSLVGFALCFLVVGGLFVDLDFLFAFLFIPLVLGVFALWFGAISIAVRRTRGDRRNSLKVLFRGLPRWFTWAFYCYFYIIWLGMLAGFVRLFQGRLGLIGLGFLLLPSVFYLACVGVYWSELRDRTTGVPGVPPLLDPPLLRGQWRSVPAMKARALVKKHWLRMLPIWLSGALFVSYAHLDPQMKFENITYIVLCIVPLVLLAFAGVLTSSKVMQENDYPLIEKTFLLIGIPFLGLAFLTHLVCVLIFGGWPSG